MSTRRWWRVGLFVVRRGLSEKEVQLRPSLRLPDEKGWGPNSPIHIFSNTVWLRAILTK